MSLESPSFRVTPSGQDQGRVYPFYIVCDASRSMWDKEFSKQPVTPLSVVEDALPDMLTALENDEVVTESAYLSVIGFGDQPELVLPLTPLSENPTIFEMKRQTETDYAKVFDFIDKQIRQDCEKLAASRLGVFTPIVFFVTDGNPQINRKAQHDATWLPKREALATAPNPPLIVSLGIGAVTDAVVLKIRSTKPIGVACAAETGAVPSDLLHAIIKSIQFTISNTPNAGFDFIAPKGMRRLG